MAFLGVILSIIVVVLLSPHWSTPDIWGALFWANMFNIVYNTFVLVFKDD